MSKKEIILYVAIFIFALSIPFTSPIVIKLFSNLPTFILVVTVSVVLLLRKK